MEPPVHGITKRAVLQHNHSQYCARITVKRKHQRTRYMKATSASPVEFDKTRLFLIEEPEMKTPQLSHIVSPHNAEDEPVPINDHA